MHSWFGTRRALASSLAVRLVRGPATVIVSIMLLGSNALPQSDSERLEMSANELVRKVVTMQVGSSVTIGTGSTFVGKILALTSITLNGETFRGKSPTLQMYAGTCGMTCGGGDCKGTSRNQVASRVSPKRLQINSHPFLHHVNQVRD
jgi:hypothetical protein